MISAEEACQKPIFTVLSGPAASAIGGIKLGKVDNTLVVDIGGTTTDIALIKDGRVRISKEGAMVSGARLRVPSVDTMTVSLGGNTGIFASRNSVFLGRKAVKPICLAPDAYNVMKDRSYLYSSKYGDVGITPTDYFCAEADSGYGNQKIAQKALYALADEAGMKYEDPCESIRWQICSRLLRSMLSHIVGTEIQEDGEGEIAVMGNDIVRPSFSLEIPVVGIGAPTKYFFDIIRDRIDGKFTIPEHYDVGNAVGAVCSSVYYKKQISIKAEKDQNGTESNSLIYYLITDKGRMTFGTKEEAITYGQSYAQKVVEQYMYRNHVQKFSTRSNVEDVIFTIADEKVYTETKITAIAEVV
ncbi:MAG: hypothetical protein LUQ09_05315 [Methanomassiliicoccales archaeon]|nr:hypothetical protein [Methanomassiliicoccales archaeon]